MKRIRIIAIDVALASLCAIGGACAQNESGNTEVKALLKRIEELEQKVKALENKASATAETKCTRETKQKMKPLECRGESSNGAAEEQPKPASWVALGSGGLSVSSADSNFVLRVRGGLQADGRFFLGDSVANNAFPVFADPAQSATRALAWAVGLNWHLNRTVKLQLNYEQTDFTGGAANPALAESEHLLLTRAQIVF